MNNSDLDENVKRACYARGVICEAKNLGYRKDEYNRDIILYRFSIDFDRLDPANGSDLKFILASSFLGVKFRHIPLLKKYVIEGSTSIDSFLDFCWSEWERDIKYGGY